MENHGQQKLPSLASKPHCYFSENIRSKHSEITSCNQGLKINEKTNNAKNQTSSLKREKKLKKKPTTELVVNLKYDEEVPAYCKYSSKKKSQKFSFAGLDICDQSRFKFLFDTSTDPENFSGKVEWDEVFEVVYSPVENLACPICIDKEMLIPIITRCGHVFCWPCLKSFENYTKGNMICPFCKEYIEPSLVRFCKINSCSQYNEGDDITFNLIMRDRRSMALYNTNMDPSLEIFNSNYKTLRRLPNENSQEFSFSKYFQCEEVEQKFDNYESTLTSALSEEIKLENCDILFDKNKIESLKQCIDELKLLRKEREFLIEVKEAQKEEDSKKSQPQQNQPSQNAKSDDKSLTYFFQEKNGDIYFLHPINYNILIAEYEGEENIPTEISGKILEIEAYQMSPTFRNQYNTLNHLRDGNFFYLVEIDLKPLVSNLTLKQFHNTLKERSKSRNMIKEEEAHYDNLVQKILEKEKEKVKMTAEKKFSYDSVDANLTLGGVSENNNSQPEAQSEKKENKLKLLLSKKK